MAKKDEFNFDTGSKFSFNLNFLKNLTKKQKQSFLMIAIGIAMLVLIVISILLFGKGGIITNIWGGPDDSGIQFGPETGVDADEISTMVISAEPNNTVYYVGEVLDLSGLTLYIKMKSGSEIYERYDAHYDKFVVSGFDSSTPTDQQVVSVTYKGKTVSFAVEIKEMPIAPPYVKSIAIDPLPKTEYVVGSSFISRTANIVATFSDGSTQTIALTRNHLVNWSEAIQKPGEHEIKVKYFDGNGGYAETTFTITVTE